MRNTIIAIDTADKWIEYCNEENLNNLKDITENPLEVKGPKGLAFLDIEELSDWMKRENLN